MKRKTLLIATLCFLSSCTTFTVVPVSPISAESIRQYEVDGKYLVLHRENEAWHMYDLELTNDSIHAKLDYQLGYLVNYLNPKKKGRNSFSKRNEPDVINSIHIYTSDNNFGNFDTLISIPVSSITEVDTYSFNRAAYRTSIILPIVLTPIILFFIIGVHQLNNMDYSGII